MAAMASRAARLPALDSGLAPAQYGRHPCLQPLRRATGFHRQRGACCGHGVPEVGSSTRDGGFNAQQLHPRPEGRSPQRLDQWEVRAAEQGGIDARRQQRRAVPCDQGLQFGAVEVAGLDVINHASTALHRHGMSAGVPLDQGLQPRTGRRRRCRQQADAPIVRRRDSGLDAGLGAHEQPIRPSSPQRLDGMGCRRVAGDHDQVGAALDQMLADREAPGADVLGAAVAVGSVGGVRQVAQAGGGEQRAKFAQHREAADAGIENADLAALRGVGVHGLRQSICMIREGSPINLSRAPTVAWLESNDRAFLCACLPGCALKIPG
mmetsp:Transcript_42342/g.99586  ORF Transcript_42342/g.99586 Transcript_42342/m.99586 type:complete len:322 (-) Transcript_42342:397-1362(-)